VSGTFCHPGEEVDRLRHVRIPDGLGRVHARLRPAIGEPGDGAAMRAVDMEVGEVVAPHARGPARIDVGDRAALELEGRIGRIVGIGLVGLALLVDALGDMGGAEAGDAFTSPKRLSST
jgi:hypothetical protein